MNKAVVALSFIGLLAGTARAADFYAGASLGLAAGGPTLDDRSASGLNEPRGDRIMTGYEYLYSGTDNLPTGQLTAGWQFREGLAVELTAFRTTEADTVETQRLTFRNGSKGSSQTAMQQQLEGFSLSLVGQKALKGTLSGFWRLGVASTRQELSYTDTFIDIALDSSSSGITRFTLVTADMVEARRKTGLMAGVGLSKGWEGAWEGRVELNGVQLEEGTLLTLGAGVIRRF